MIWEARCIGDFLTESTTESADPSAARRIRVRLNAGGVEKRPLLSEAEGATRYFRRSAGQFIYGKQNLHKGAFGIIPDDLDGFESSSDLPAFDVSDGLKPKWLDYFLKQGNFYKSLVSIARGAATKRIQPDALFKISIPIPPLNVQEKIIARMDLCVVEHAGLEREIGHQESLLAELQQAIYQEAIQGKLTTDWRKMHPKVEPASLLLQHIQAEKARLVDAKELRPEKPLPKIKRAEIPFEIPKTWEWCRLVDICGFITKGTTPAPHELKPEGDIPFLKVYNIRGQQIDFNYKPQFIDRRIHEGTLSRSIVYPRDVLMNIVGPPLGKVAIVSSEHKEWNINQALAVFRPLVIEIHRFLYIYLCEGAPIRATTTKGVVGQDNISLAQCRALMFPLPPLAEQAAIVARVEELQTNCRLLAAQIANSRTHAAHLLQAALKEAFTP